LAFNQHAAIAFRAFENPYKDRNTKPTHTPFGNLAEVMSMVVNDSLTELFLKHDGKAIDKWEQYLGVYECEFAALAAAGRPLRLLEVGVQNGGSLELWRKVLSEDSEICGLDIDPRVAALEFESSVRVHVADATDAARLQEILGSATFDVIIDDGSHICSDVCRTFELLFHHLAPGGRYVIEDLHCSYHPNYGGGLRSAGSSIEYLKHLVDSLHCDYLAADAVDPAEFAGLTTYNRSLARITFYDSIAVVEKLPTEKVRPYRRILGGDAAALQPISNWMHFFPTANLQALLFGHPAVRQFEQAFFEELDQRRGEVSTLVNTVATLHAEVETLRASLNDCRLENDRLAQGAT
jgi:SAM-dependent methyltransferase